MVKVESSERLGSEADLHGAHLPGGLMLAEQQAKRQRLAHEPC
jgi:hypothetical protein